MARRLARDRFPTGGQSLRLACTNQGRRAILRTDRTAVESTDNTKNREYRAITGAPVETSVTDHLAPVPRPVWSCAVVLALSLAFAGTASQAAAERNTDTTVSSTNE